MFLNTKMSKMAKIAYHFDGPRIKTIQKIL